MQKCVDKGKEINLMSAINKEIVTRGLRCVASNSGGAASCRWLDEAQFA